MAEMSPLSSFANESSCGEKKKILRKLSMIFSEPRFNCALAEVYLGILLLVPPCKGTLFRNALALLLPSGYFVLCSSFAFLVQNLWS